MMKNNRLQYNVETLKRLFARCSSVSIPMGEPDTRYSKIVSTFFSGWFAGTVGTSIVLRRTTYPVHMGVSLSYAPSVRLSRPSDLKVHVRKFHESDCSKMPAEMFSENN